MVKSNNNNNNEMKDRVKSIYEIMSAENLDEIEIDSKEYSLYIKRRSANSAPINNASKPAIVENAPAPQTPIEKPQAPKAQLGETIKSPITGVFYRAAAPTSPPFVSEGDIVESAQTLCIVEAMKVMNEIKASFKVKVIKILIENAAPVSAGQDLFEIEKL
jgi:acetyl-CoA carboxylase biotin carboxyl carrier protein